MCICVWVRETEQGRMVWNLAFSLLQLFSVTLTTTSEEVKEVCSWPNHLISVVWQLCRRHGFEWHWVNPHAIYSTLKGISSFLIFTSLGICRLPTHTHMVSLTGKQAVVLSSPMFGIVSPVHMYVRVCECVCLCMCMCVRVWQTFKSGMGVPGCHEGGRRHMVRLWPHSQPFASSILTHNTHLWHLTPER
jgi:hypothetical protein